LAAANTPTRQLAARHATANSTTRNTGGGTASSPSRTAASTCSTGQRIAWKTGRKFMTSQSTASRIQMSIGSRYVSNSSYIVNLSPATLPGAAAAGHGVGAGRRMGRAAGHLPVAPSLAGRQGCQERALDDNAPQALGLINHRDGNGRFGTQGDDLVQPRVLGHRLEIPAEARLQGPLAFRGLDDVVDGQIPLHPALAVDDKDAGDAALPHAVQRGLWPVPVGDHRLDGLHDGARGQDLGP